MVVMKLPVCMVFFTNEGHDSISPHHLFRGFEYFHQMFFRGIEPQTSTLWDQRCTHYAMPSRLKFSPVHEANSLALASDHRKTLSTQRFCHFKWNPSWWLWNCWYVLSSSPMKDMTVYLHIISFEDLNIFIKCFSKESNPRPLCFETNAVLTTLCRQG